jgi:hypothetical protein
VSQDRYVRNNSTTVTAPDFGHFQASIASAFQTSDIFADSLQDIGAISRNDTRRSTRSYYGVIFELLVSADYTLEGELDAGGSTAFAQSSVQFRPVGGADIHFRVAGPFHGGPFSFFGTLPPGQYELMLDTFGSNGDPIGGASDGSFSGTLTLVPEPASIGLLLLGAMLVMRGRRA